MSDLVYQNYNNRCQGWINPSNLVFGPKIGSLSGYYSPAGSTTLVSILGENFLSYSVVAFGSYNPTVYFINSNTLQFYVPSTLNSGTFPVQVFNGGVASNIVTYTIDNASGYWLLNSNGTISNTNSASILVSSLSRGEPMNIEAGDYIVQDTDNWIICNTQSGFIRLILPTTPKNIGREIMVKNVFDITGNSVFSASSNIIPLTGGLLTTPTNLILTNTSGKWATLVFNGTYWIIMQGN